MTCPLHPDTEQPCHVCGIARVRAALAVAPRTRRPGDEADTTQARAIERARADRTRPEEQP